MKTFLVFALCLLSVSVASAQSPCPGGVCLKRPFLSVRAPAGSSIHVSRGLFRYRVYVNGLNGK